MTVAAAIFAAGWARSGVLASDGGVPAQLAGVVGDGVDPVCEVAVVGLEVRAGRSKRGDEGGVVVGQGLAEMSEAGAGSGGAVGQGGDLPGEGAQVGRVGTGPRGDGPVGARRSRVALTRCSPVVPSAPGRSRR